MINWKRRNEDRLSEEIFKKAFKDSFRDKIKNGGFRSYFKVRFGSYRIGLKVENGTVILERALHRKDIYRYYL